MQVRPCDVVRIRELYSVDDKPIRVPDAARLTHLQFSRFAGCPICNLHLQSMVDQHGEIVAAGVRQVVLFHSTPDEAGTFARDLPFDVVRIRTRNSTRNSEWKRRCGVCSIRARRHQWSEHFFGLPGRSGCVPGPEARPTPWGGVG